jgi:hypothetical protein
MAHVHLRRAGFSLLALVLTLSLFAGSLSFASAADTANIYLIAIGDNGQSGTVVGCQDSLVPVTGLDIGNQPTAEGKIAAALGKLFAIHDQYYGESGLYNALYMSHLSVDSVKLDGSRAVVHISGTTQLGGTCDTPRVIGQIQATVLQFPGITRADIVYQGDLLNLVLSERGEHPELRYFPETDHLVGHGFLKYWQTFGGLATFGYPISEEYTDPHTGFVTQWFERARFEWHPGADPSHFDVLLGLLGNEVTAGRHGEAPFQPVSAASDANCTYYAVTSHRLCFGFRDFWQSHGGLAILGYPISEEFQENGYTVQYFERQRLEYHPENPPAWQIEGGLLGVQVMAMQ